MTLPLLFANNATTTIAAPLGPTATTITLSAGTGALFPSPTPGESIFVLTLNDAATRLAYETCWVTARSGDVLTVLRGQEGTTQQSWNIGDYAFNDPTAGTMEALVQTTHMYDATIAPVFGNITSSGWARLSAGALGVGDPARVVTWGDFPFHTGNPGWVQFPNNLMIQYGQPTISASGSGQASMTITFPVAFATEGDIAWIGAFPNTEATSHFPVIGISNQTNANFLLTLDSMGTGNIMADVVVNWICIGYGPTE